jgi:hypothetical protein
MKHVPLRWTLCWAWQLAAVGCASTPVWNGLDTSSGANLLLTAAPSGHYELAGRYSSPQLGELRLWQEGSQIRGEFFAAIGGTRGVLGVLRGSLQGNLLRFSWRERSPITRLTQAHGHGFLLYQPAEPTDGRPARLYGRRDYTIPAPQPAHLPQEATRPGEPLSAARAREQPQP